MTRVKLCIALMTQASSEPIEYVCEQSAERTLINMRTTCYHLRNAAQAIGDSKFDGLKFSIVKGDSTVALRIEQTIPPGEVRKVL